MIGRLLCLLVVLALALSVFAEEVVQEANAESQGLSINNNTAQHPVHFPRIPTRHSLSYRSTLAHSQKHGGRNKISSVRWNTLRRGGPGAVRWNTLKRAPIGVKLNTLLRLPISALRK
ncbi:asparagine tRS [Acrasis kona]|uniref:Asparagine tRS n=1 Tax=Acrasis kona TaxID=1008807 RepID=A0AAW2YLN1_9EUKA